MAGAIRVKRARVAMIVPAFPVRSETFIVAKAVELAAAGWDVHVVCQRRVAALLAELPERARTLLRGRIHATWPHRPRWYALILAPFALLRCLVVSPLVTARYLSRGGSLRRLYLDAELICLAPAIIHFEFGPLAVGRIELGRLLDARTVVSFRGYDLNYIGLEDPAYFTAIWRSASAIHTLGEDLWLRAIRRGCSATKAHALIPPAVDGAYFDPKDKRHFDVAGSEQRPLRILSVGRLEWKKGYEYGLEAVRMLIDQGVHAEYRIIGSGEFHTATAFARHQLRLTQDAQLLGAQPQEHVRDEMRWADILLHPAVSEGFGNAVLEAQAMMLPVVCTTADGLRENIADGETGMLAPSRDPEALARAMASLARDPAARQRMGAAGRRRVLERFRLSDQIAAFGALYESVLSPVEAK
jgi:colanic acid/amylovoran biosynthesis glycosyltransferase